MSPSSRRPLTAGVCAAAVLTLAAAPQARADLKLVSRATANGKTSTTTTYYKGNRIRSEALGPNGQPNVVIFDGTGKMYVLNAARRTYTVLSPGDFAKMPGMNMMDISSSVTLNPTGKTKNIIGKPARQYAYTATIRMNFKQAFINQMKAQGRATGKLPTLPTVVIQGEQWVSEAVPVPRGAILSAMSGFMQFPGMKPVLDKFASVKGLPLESRQTVTMKGATMGGRSLPKPQTTTMTASSLSAAPLPDSLFAVPAGYTQQNMGGAAGAVRSARPR